MLSLSGSVRQQHIFGGLACRWHKWRAPCLTLRLPDPLQERMQCTSAPSCIIHKAQSHLDGSPCLLGNSCACHEQCLPGLRLRLRFCSCGLAGALAGTCCDRNHCTQLILEASTQVHGAVAIVAEQRHLQVKACMCQCFAGTDKAVSSVSVLGQHCLQGMLAAGVMCFVPLPILAMAAHSLQKHS